MHLIIQNSLFNRTTQFENVGRNRKYILVKGPDDSLGYHHWEYLLNGHRFQSTFNCKRLRQI